VTKPKILEAAQIALPKHFDVDASTMEITVTESRRLHGAAWSARKLAGTFNVAFTFEAPADKVAEVSTKVAEIQTAPEVYKTALTTAFKTALTTAGVDQAVVDAITVTAASATDAHASSTTSMRMTTVAPNTIVGGTTSTVLSLAVIAGVYLVGM